MERLDRRFRKHMEWVGKLSPSRQLAGTCGAEHYTAVLANAILSHPEWLEGATPVMAKLWRWHAIEETEHKSVAFDVYRECVGNQRLRRIIFLFVTWNFFKYTFLNTCSLLKTDGKLWSLRTWLGGLSFLWANPVFCEGVCLTFWRTFVKASTRGSRITERFWRKTSVSWILRQLSYNPGCTEIRCRVCKIEP